MSILLAAERPRCRSNPGPAARLQTWRADDGSDISRLSMSRISAWFADL